MDYILFLQAFLLLLPTFFSVSIFSSIQTTALALTLICFHVANSTELGVLRVSGLFSGLILQKQNRAGIFHDKVIENIGMPAKLNKTLQIREKHKKCFKHLCSATILPNFMNLTILLLELDISGKAKGAF